MVGQVGRVVEELAWLSFYLPRQGVQELSKRLPLEALRARLPAVVSERLRLGLYPARITDARRVECARVKPEWGDPAELDVMRRVEYRGAPRASLLMVTYNNLSLTRLCLASVQRAAGALPFEVVVVDNGSVDGTREHLRAEVERGLLPLRVRENEENVGFAAANNQAAGMARGDVLVFLNNDTVVVPGWLERLVGHLDIDPSVGLVGPVSNSSGGSAGQVEVDYGDLEGMERFAEGYTGGRRGQLERQEMATLFCAAMPAALYRRVGGLDEGYGRGLFEDDDLCEAVKQQGYTVGLARDVFVHHYGGASFGQLPGAEYLRLWWGNRRRFERKWGKRWAKR